MTARATRGQHRAASPGLAREPGGRPSDSPLDRTLAALADPHRRRVVELLSDGPRRAGELAAATGLSPPAMSRHLKTLKAGGLIEDSHPAFDARVRVYALRPEPMTGLKTWLEETERLWTGALLAFKAHLEAPPPDPVPRPSPVPPPAPPPAPPVRRRGR